MSPKSLMNFFLSSILLFVCISCSTEKNITSHPEWSKNLSIYELNVRQFSEEGTFKAVEEHLPRLKEMGVGIIWFMPIHPIGELNRKGSMGSYYSVKDFMDVNPDFGTMEDFKNLVSKIHEHGMYVIIDWVPNHSAWDNNLVATNPEFYTKDSLGNFIPPVPDWSDVIDFNYDNKELWNYMLKALKFWIEECDIDGYRCDVAGMVPVEFWNFVRPELNKVKDIFMLAEWESPGLHSSFDMTYGWDLHHIMNDVAQGKIQVDSIDQYFLKQDIKYSSDDYRMYFTSNHDENSWNGTVFERMGDAAEVMAIFSAVVPGMPLVYSGQEAGMNKRLAFFEKDPIEWREHKLKEVYTKLLNLKKNNSALWNGNFGGEMIRLKTGNDLNIFAIFRQKGNDKIIAILNFSNEYQKVAISDEIINGDYYDLFTNEEIILNAKINLELKSWGYKILVKK